jgi:pilus assembly protein CpaC
LKIRALITSACLAVFIWANGSVWAQDLQMMVNELKVFTVQKIERVAISDPAVADVTVLSEEEIMLIAKKAGATTLIIWDESGQRTFNITVIEQDLEKTAQKISGLLDSSDIRGLRLKTEEDNVYVIGDALTEYELAKVQDVLEPFTNVVNLVRIRERQPLLEIDVNVLEVAYDDLKKLGLSWTSLLPVTYTEPSGTRTAGSAYDPKSHITGKAPKLWRVFKWDRSTINAKLNFLITEGHARTLANPKLVTLSGKEASFLVGGEVPYITVETEGRTSVQWKDYGVNLKINPLINSKNEINTKLRAEVTDLDWANAVTHQGYSIPAIKKREAQTELFLNEGDTIFLAGLIKNEDSRNVDRLPWLGKIPILGELFKSREFRDQRTELVISLTPKIVGEKATPEYAGRRKPEQIGQKAPVSTSTVQQQAAASYDNIKADSPLTYYSHMIEDIITRNVVYPAQAKEAGLEGSVEIDLYLLSNGQLREVKLKKPSGIAILDQTALAAVEKQAPYPAFPEQITQKELKLSVPVIFKGYSHNE